MVTDKGIQSFWFLPMTPKGKDRPRHTRSGVTYTPSGTRDWEAEAAVRLRGDPAWQSFGGAAVRVSIEAMFGTTDKRKHNKPHRTRPDLDNIAKIVLDAMVKAGVLADDCQVVMLCCSKRHVFIGNDNQPGVCVSVKRMDA